MRRGEVYDARLDPTEGSEQAGSRPVVIVSRNAINTASPVFLAVPCTTYRPGRRLYPSQVLIHAPDGGLEVDAVAMGEQVRALAKSRLGRRRGVLAPQTMAQLDRALLIRSRLSGNPFFQGGEEERLASKGQQFLTQSSAITIGRVPLCDG